MESRISNDLYDLTEAVSKIDPELLAHGFLGGEFGYGAYFENDVFQMRPFWWGDCECGHEDADWKWCESNEHSGTCYQSIVVQRGYIKYGSPNYEATGYYEREAINDQVTEEVCAEMGLDPRLGSVIHCTCDYQIRYSEWKKGNDHDPSCGVVAPNFRHKETGFEVRWYKYIGRSMEWDDSISKEDWREIYNECMDSLKEVE